MLLPLVLLDHRSCVVRQHFCSIFDAVSSRVDNSRTWERLTGMLLDINIQSFTNWLTLYTLSRNFQLCSRWTTLGIITRPGKATAPIGYQLKACRLRMSGTYLGWCGYLLKLILCSVTLCSIYLSFCVCPPPSLSSESPFLFLVRLLPNQVTIPPP